MTHLKYFLYSFFLNSVFFLCIFYLGENFNKPFADLNNVDIGRAIVVGIVQLSILLLIPDLQSKFPEIRRKIKYILLFGSMVTASLTILFLISIYSTT